MAITFEQFARKYFDPTKPVIPWPNPVQMAETEGASESSIQDYLDYVRKAVQKWASDPATFMLPCPPEAMIKEWNIAHPPPVVSDPFGNPVNAFFGQLRIDQVKTLIVQWVREAMRP